MSDTLHWRHLSHARTLAQIEYLDAQRQAAHSPDYAPAWARMESAQLLHDVLRMATMDACRDQRLAAEREQK